MSKRHTGGLTGGLNDVLWLSLVLTFDSHLSCYSCRFYPRVQRPLQQRTISRQTASLQWPSHQSPPWSSNDGKQPSTRHTLRKNEAHSQELKNKSAPQVWTLEGGKLLKRNRRHKPDWNVMGKKKLWSVFIYFLVILTKLIAFNFLVILWTGHGETRSSIF